MGQFISSAAFKLRQSFRTSTDFIGIGSRLFIFDRRQWFRQGRSISAWIFNSLNSVTSVNEVYCVDFQCPLPYRVALCRYEATFAGVVSQLTTPMQSADLSWTDADSQWKKVYVITVVIKFHQMLEITKEKIHATDWRQGESFSPHYLRSYFLYTLSVSGWIPLRFNFGRGGNVEGHLACDIQRGNCWLHS